MASDDKNVVKTKCFLCLGCVFYEEHNNVCNQFHDTLKEEKNINRRTLLKRIKQTVKFVLALTKATKRTELIGSQLFK